MQILLLVLKFNFISPNYSDSEVRAIPKPMKWISILIKSLTIQRITIMIGKLEEF